MAETPEPERALAAISLIHSAPTRPQLLVRLVDATAAIGASASLYAIALPEGEGSGKDASSIALFACDPVLAQGLLMRGPIHHHPWFQFARSRSLAATDADISIESGSGHAGKHEQDCGGIAMAGRHGFASCLILPVATQVGLSRLDVLCLGHEQPCWFDTCEAVKTRLLARTLASELHDWFTRHLRESLRQSAQISDADLRLLSYEWQGLGTKAIASRTGQSLAAVDSRFQRINIRMNCASRSASARRAAEHGLLDRRSQL